MLATCRIPCPLRTACVNLILKISFTYIRTDMLATCRIPCSLRTASEYFIYTYLNYFNLYIQIVIFLYARTCWPHAVSHVRCAPQVDILLIPI